MKWASGLVALAMCAMLVSNGAPRGNWPVLLVSGFLSWVALSMTFAAYSGGLAVPRPIPTRGIAVRALLVSTLSYLLLAYAAPIAQYRETEAQGVDVSRQYPFGPATPSALRSLKEAIEASPPETYLRSADDPFQTPPNWLTHLIHNRFAYALFAVFAAFLGQLVGFLTTGLSPPARMNARWAGGVLSGGAYFAAVVVFDGWVGGDPSRSGIVSAWAPLLIPMVELALLLWLARVRMAREGREPEAEGP